jgi:hypothetical protein
MGKTTSNSSYLLYIGAVVIVVLLIAFAANQERQPAIYDDFAQCLTDQGVSMYGAWWCPHCENQKRELGDSFDFITYTECSLPGSRAMSQECRSAGIEGYPTWEFADGSRASGEQSLQALSEKSGCDLPEGA